MNISLIGMMGSGKTTIAKLIAKKSGIYTFVDTDDLIVNSIGMSINDIFRTKGEFEFRKIESDILTSVLEKDNQVISTGGGIIKSDANVSVLSEKSIVFYLKADADTLYNRIKNNKDRPLLNSGDMYNKIRMLLDERSDKYMQARYVIDTINKEPDEIAEEILLELKNYDTSRS